MGVAGCRQLIWRKELHENFDVRLVSELLNEGFDADSVIAEGLAGSPDETIYETCKAVSRTLVTLDLDFSSPLRFPPEHSEGIVVVASPESRALIDSGYPSAHWHPLLFYCRLRTAF